MKLLLLGAGGQVGFELHRSLAPLGEVVAATRDGRLPGGGRGEVADLSDPASLEALLQIERPDVIVNAAAYTAVDRAESEPELATRINAEAPAVLARWCKVYGARLLHYSTDYVFDGSGSTPWSEDATTGPLSVYGRTKCEGEERIRASGCCHLIFRTSWVYAARGGNFAKTMLKLAAERDKLTIIDDQHGAPTGAELLADVSAHAARMTLANPALAGTYHLAAAGETTWHGYARHVIEFARARGIPIQVAADAIRPVPTSAFPTPAARPLNSRLDTGKLQRAFGLIPPPWQQGIDRMLEEIL